jgi:hypothetical protein
VAEATARELGRISLAEALELTILIAQKEPKRLPKVAVHWLQRYLKAATPHAATKGESPTKSAGAPPIQRERPRGGAFRSSGGTL